MTTANERTQALLWAGELLRELQSLVEAPGVLQKTIEDARQILRHYPSAYEIQRIAEQTEESSAVPLLHSKF